MIWKQVPFLRLILPLVLGIYLYYFFPTLHYLPSLFGLLISIGMLIGFNFLNDHTKQKFAFVRGIFIHSAILSFGYFCGVLNNVRTYQQWYGHHIQQHEYVMLRIANEPQAKPKTRKVQGEIIALGKGDTMRNTSGEAFVYVKHSAKADSLKEGDIILVKNNFKPIPSAANPGAFDYAQYCKTKNIFHSAFVQDNEWQYTGQHRQDIHSFFGKVSAATRTMLAENIKDSSSLGIAEALLIGYKGDIDKDLWQAYSNTGIVHIIAISGMHMAFIYTGIHWLLFLIPWMKRQRIFALLIAVFFMWLFASVTGFPPSVTRAAVMFTFIGVGEMLNRDTSHLNNLLASAFFLLCIHPYWLHDIGFQLSYLAVLSLVIFYKPIYHWFYFSKTLPDTIWKLMSGTIAAQILTFPLCMYYFHQFPILFILTNLIAVPLTTCVLYAELLLLIFYGCKPIALFLGNSISHTIAWLNKGVLYIDNFSFVVWSNIQINLVQMILLFAFLSCISIWLLNKKNSFVSISLLSLLLFISSFTIQRAVRLKQQKLIVYNAPKQSVMEFISGEYYYSPDTLVSTDKVAAQGNSVHAAHLFFGVKKENCAIVKKIGNEVIEAYAYGNKRIVRIQNENFKSAYPLKVDVLVIAFPCMPNADWIKANFLASQIVLDSSLPAWKCEAYSKELASLHLPIHAVATQGAFTVAL